MKWLVKHRVHGAKPWAVQIEAMRRSEGRDKYAYFIEMGMGKTALTFNDYINDDDVDLMVVFAPNSFKFDWTFVPEEWGRPDIPAWHYPKHEPPFDQEVGVYAVNYECARSNAKASLRRLLQTRKCLLVIDESTSIKNPNSAVSKGVRELAKIATKVRLLNGTPLANNVIDYYPQLRCVGELNGWTPIAFRNRYAEMGGYMGEQVIGRQNEEELAEILDRCSFRALKKDWRKDLPPQIIVDPVHVEMTKVQRVHYREMMEEFYTQVDGVDVVAEMVLTQYDKLRQLSSCLAINGIEFRYLEPHDKNPKMNAAFDLHDGGPGKTIIVYWYRPSGMALYERATQLGLKPAIIRGRMKPEELIEEKRRFNDDPDCRVMIAQEDAASRGHTLIGGEGRNSCNKTVFYEQGFVYWMRAQMQDRNHRGSQAEPCNIFDIVTSPMDQFCLDVFLTKRDLADGMDELVKLVRERKY